MGNSTLSKLRLTWCSSKAGEQMAGSNQHWLSQTPTEYLNRYVSNEWSKETSNRQELPNIRYYSFTIRAFVFRGDRLFLTNRNNNPGVTEELTVPTDRFDVTIFSAGEGEVPVYQVNQQEQQSIGDHIKTVLSSRYQHPNILQNARFLDEFSVTAPMVRRRIEATTWGDTELHLCDLEISVVMSKYDGSLGNGPAFRWITESQAISVDEGPQLVAGLDIFHLTDVFSRYRLCRNNQYFHERCTEDIRAALRLRWKQNDIDRSHRFGVLARKFGAEEQGTWVFTMTSTDAAMRKNSNVIFYESLRYEIVGWFGLENVQIVPEVEIWRAAVDDHGNVKVNWCEHTSRKSFLRLLPP